MGFNRLSRAHFGVGTVIPYLAGRTSPRWPRRRWLLNQSTQQRVASSASVTVRHGPCPGPRMSSVS